ncbi:Bax inhibitor-1/YccA family protein [Bifidobacterium choloepi]|uniref:BAX inhibitor (BI)-1/YccA family protein n=1 Tax=Bifidobacterium choloepi TaxID=2614131 RepID=A0A6I5MZN9_9BIFI|nr:Bax inhibitor-1/YccA family protein [Bifidobacterium choloepi]NEG70118.1 BAX inhibitor (BI)-1/YccA family protein [Bifidobacterium choloepi]
MTYGQQPNGNGSRNNGSPQYYSNGNQYNNGQYNGNQYYNNGYQQGYNGYQQPGYGQPYNPYGNGGAPVDTQAVYAREQAQRVSVTRAYGEMTLGLLVTAVVAILTQASGWYLSFAAATGGIGCWIFAIVQIGLAIYLGARIMQMKASTARVMFYVFAALMGVTLSTIFVAYDLGTIGITLLVCAGFFFVLTMLGMTTKINLMKFGTVLMVGLIVLIVAELLIYIFAPTATNLMLISALGVILFAGMTIYDGQFTKKIFAQYRNADPETIKKISIICALNLYLDFVNMFLYLLQIFGDRR